MKNIIKVLKKYSISIIISIIVIACISIFGVSQIENVHKIKYYLPNLFFGATNINHLHKYSLITMIILLFILLNQIDKEYNKKIKQSENTQDFFKVAIISGLLYGLLIIVAALIGVYIGSIIYDIKFGYGFYINYFQFFIMIYALSYSFILFISYITKNIKLSLLLYFCIFFIVPNIYIELGYTTLSDFKDNNFLNLFFLDFNYIGYKMLDFNITDQLLWIIIILFCSILPVISINKIKNINFKLHISMICIMLISILIFIYALKNNLEYYQIFIIYISLIIFYIIIFKRFIISNKKNIMTYYILTFVVLFPLLMFNLSNNKEQNNINSIVEFSMLLDKENKDYINILKNELKKSTLYNYNSAQIKSYASINVIILDENGYYDVDIFYISRYSEFFNMYNMYNIEFIKEYIENNNIEKVNLNIDNNHDKALSEDKTCINLNTNFFQTINENELNYNSNYQEVLVVFKMYGLYYVYFPIDVNDYQEDICKVEK